MNNIAYERIKIIEHEKFLIYLIRNLSENDEQLYYALYEKYDEKSFYLVRTFRIYKAITLYGDLLKTKLDDFQSIEKVIENTKDYIYIILRDIFHQQYADEIWYNLCMLDIHNQTIETINEEELYHVEVH